mmetsp:Transcript_25267/g.50393  ORF Transcript_25267/g.50393 Transcript_25267/m.50393 type:complete len:221 (+) Transcript_25267:207-869(+)
MVLHHRILSIPSHEYHRVDPPAPALQSLQAAERHRNPPELRVAYEYRGQPEGRVRSSLGRVMSFTIGPHRRIFAVKSLAFRASAEPRRAGREDAPRSLHVRHRLLSLVSIPHHLLYRPAHFTIRKEYSRQLRREVRRARVLVEPVQCPRLKPRLAAVAPNGVLVVRHSGLHRLHVEGGQAQVEGGVPAQACRQQRLTDVGIGAVDHVSAGRGRVVLEGCC